MTSAPAAAVPRVSVLLRAPLAAAGLVLTATAYVAAVDPTQPGHYPTCPLLALTGLSCPMCGSLRAVHELAQGDVVAAVGHNVLTVVGLLVVVAAWVRWVARSARGLPTRLQLPARATPVLLTALAVFGVVRNLPFGSALGP